MQESYDRCAGLSLFSMLIKSKSRCSRAQVSCPRAAVVDRVVGEQVGDEGLAWCRVAREKAKSSRNDLVVLGTLKTASCGS
jgi:hypothetical protein